MIRRTACSRNWRADAILCIGIILFVLASCTGASDANVVKQWGVFEKGLVTTQEYSDREKYTLVGVEATFRGPDGRAHRVPGFWDGASTWRVRFSPPMPGEWSYMISSSDSVLDKPGNDGTFVAVAPTAAEIAANPNYRGFLKISSNGRYVAYADGIPFFWMGGTIWKGNWAHMPFGEDFRAYVDNRKSKKFSVIQLNVGDPISTSSGNEGGALFIKKFDVINPSNFQWLDKRIEYITHTGMVPVITGQWADALEEMPLDDLKRYWKYLVARYHAYNVIWVISGEYGFCDCLEKIRGLANYVHQLDWRRHLITIHPTPNPPIKNYSSAEEFFGERWIDFHMHQTWDQEKTRNVMVVDYNRSPAVPAVNAEAGYDGPWNWSRDKVREDAWTVYMSGGAGYTYGAHGIWAWNDGRKDDYLPSHPRWPDVIDLESSFDMQRIVEFFEVIEWWKLVPRDDLVSTGYALASPEREYLIYLPFSKRTFGMRTLDRFRLHRWVGWLTRLMGWNETVTVDLSEAMGTLHVEWLNPRTGERVAGSIIMTKGRARREFTAPFQGDAVLYIASRDRAAR